MKLETLWRRSNKTSKARADIKRITAERTPTRRARNKARKFQQLELPLYEKGKS